MAAPWNTGRDGALSLAVLSDWPEAEPREPVIDVGSRHTWNPASSAFSITERKAMTPGVD